MIVWRHLGLQPYEPIWRAMQRFTDCRSIQTVDEIWLLEHAAVYTQGMAGKAEHVVQPGAIPVVQIDRGGQVTYHGPGQLVVYFLLDLKRRQLSPRQLVSLIETAVVSVLTESGCHAYARADAPGIYVEGEKIGSIGLRIRRGACYHGLSINVKMDLTPFLGINPCGYSDLKVTQVCTHMPELNFNDFQQLIEAQLSRTFL